MRHELWTELEGIFGRVIGQTIQKVQQILRGSTNLVYLVTTDQDHYIVKIAHRPDRIAGQVLEKEARMLSRFGKSDLPLPIPRVVWSGYLKDDWPVLVETFIPGERIEVLISPDINTDQAAFRLGAFVAALHEISHPVIEEFEQGKETSEDFANYATKLLGAWKSLCEQAMHIPQADIKKAYRRILDNLKLFDESAWPFVHGDISRENVLGKIENGELVLTGVVDFENVQSGPPEYDFATTDDALFLFFPALEKKFFEGYQSMRALPENFAERLVVVNLFRALRYIKRTVRYNETHYLKHDQDYFNRWINR